MVYLEPEHSLCPVKKELGKLSGLGWYAYSEFVGIYILLVWAIYLPFRGGQLYNGPIYCMTIGAYATAYASKSLNWPFGLALLLAIGVGGIIGFLTSFAFSRTTGIVTATTSLALIFILQSIVTNINFLGGPVGILNITRVGYLPVVIWASVLLVGLLIYRIDTSRIGRALEALRTDPELAATMGIDLQWLSVFAMSIASIIGSIAGVYYAFSIGSISPDLFGFSLLLYTMAMLFIGGRYTMWGVIISVPILWGLPLWVPPSVSPYMNLILGVLLVIILMARPEGIVSRETVHLLKLWVSSWSGKNRIPTSS